jgi:ammonia channel protein AmtB
MRRAGLILGCLGLWILLFRVSRNNHPTAELNAIATTIMTVAAALSFLVISRIFAGRPMFVRACAGALVLLLSGTLAAMAISGVYDLEIGPDPRRISAITNIELDTVVVVVFAAVLGGLDRILRLMRRG